jgi:hypothetical protein
MLDDYGEVTAINLKTLVIFVCPKLGRERKKKKRARRDTRERRMEVKMAGEVGAATSPSS